jgi:hypothetical protein
MQWTEFWAVLSGFSALITALTTLGARDPLFDERRQL